MFSPECIAVRNCLKEANGRLSNDRHKARG